MRRALNLLEVTGDPAFDPAAGGQIDAEIAAAPRQSEGELARAQAVVYPAYAAKSNAVYSAWNAALADARAQGSRDVPIHRRNAPARLMKERGYGKRYRYAHDEPDGYAAGEQYFPDGATPRRYYVPVDRGLEIRIREKLARLEALDRAAGAAAKPRGASDAARAKRAQAVGGQVAASRAVNRAFRRPAAMSAGECQSSLTHQDSALRQNWLTLPKIHTQNKSIKCDNKSYRLTHMARDPVTTMTEDSAEQCRPGMRQPPKDFCEALRAALLDGGDHDGARFGARSLDRLRLTRLDADSLALDVRCDLGAPTVAAWIQLAGAAHLRQGERTADVAAGEACMIRSARPLSLQLIGPARAMLVEVPEQQLVDRFKLWRHALLRPVRATSGAPAIFMDAIESIWRWSDELGSAIHDSVASAVIDLMGAMICFTAPVNPDCVSRAFHQQERIRKAARTHLRNPDLSVELIADAVDLSPRQVHRLFANEQLPLMRWIWVQRLEHCYREIRDVQAMHRSIGEIAYAWGFNDQAHFSRAFRKHFGVTPRQVRMRATAALESDASTR